MVFQKGHPVSKECREKRRIAMKKYWVERKALGFGPMKRIKTGDELRKWLLNNSNKVKDFYRAVFEDRKPEGITKEKWMYFRYTVIKDVAKEILSPRVSGKEEIKPLPVEILYGKKEIQTPSISTKSSGEPKKIYSNADGNPGGKDTMRELLVSKGVLSESD